MEMSHEVTNNRNNDSCHLWFASHCAKHFIWILLSNNHNILWDSYNHLLGYRLYCCNKRLKIFSDLDNVEMYVSPWKDLVGCLGYHVEDPGCFCAIALLPSILSFHLMAPDGSCWFSYQVCIPASRKSKKEKVSKCIFLLMEQSKSYAHHSLCILLAWPSCKENVGFS